jgi:hypothetical protein
MSNNRVIRSLVLGSLNTNRVRRTLLWAAAIVPGLLLGTGCSSKTNTIPTFPVTGKVDVKGEAPEGAFLVFHPKTPIADAPRPRANVGPDGSFDLSTFDAKDGAPAGEYAVTIEWYKLVKEGNDVKAGPNVIPRQYLSPETTPLKVTVKEGPNQLEPFKIVR